MVGELVNLALHNLMRARVRFIMTAGGVLVGTAAVILLIALTFGLQRAAEGGLGESATLTQLDVYPPYEAREGARTPKLNAETLRDIRRIPGVSAVIPLLWLDSTELVADPYTGYAQVIGIDARVLSSIGLQAAAGELSLRPGQAIAGSQVRTSFYDPTSEEFAQVEVDVLTQPPLLRLYRQDGARQEVPLSITAELAQDNTFDYALLIPINDWTQWREWATGEPVDPQTLVYNQVIVRARDRDDVQGVVDGIKALGLNVSGPGELLNQLNSFFGMMRLMLGGIGGVALLVAAFGVANTMTMAILERTREIGLMKAIGATDRDVLTIFLVESAAVGLAGGAGGVGVALLLQNVINRVVAGMQPSQDANAVSYVISLDLSQLGGQLIVISPELIGFALLLATAVGVGAGIYPAVRASRMTTVLALKTD